jgi:hypothetical protein
MDREQTLDELARCFMRAAVDRLFDEKESEAPGDDQRLVRSITDKEANDSAKLNAGVHQGATSR